jgi:hypothetical protein
VSNLNILSYDHNEGKSYSFITSFG